MAPAKSQVKTTRRVAKRPAEKAKTEPGPEQKRPALRLETGVWGKPPPGTSRFGLHKKLPGGTSERCRLPDGGVLVQSWPIRFLCVDWVRRHWGEGTYQASWLGPRPHPKTGEVVLSGVGKSNTVPILAHVDPVRRPNGYAIGYAGDPVAPPAMLPPASSPDERDRVLDFERAMHKRELAQVQELATERAKLDQQRLSFELEKKLDRRLAELERERAEPEERDPSAWAPIITQVGELLKAATPAILKFLGAVSSGGKATT